MDDILLNLQVLLLMSPILIISFGYIYYVDSKKQNFQYNLHKEAFRLYYKVKCGELSYEHYVEYFIHSHANLKLTGDENANLHTLFNLLKGDQSLIETYYAKDRLRRQDVRNLVKEWNLQSMSENEIETKTLVDVLVNLDIQQKIALVNAIRIYLFEDDNAGDPKGKKCGLVFAALKELKFIVDSKKDTNREKFYSIIIRTFKKDGLQFAKSGLYKYSDIDTIKYSCQNDFIELKKRLDVRQ